MTYRDAQKKLSIDVNYGGTDEFCLRTARGEAGTLIDDLLNSQSSCPSSLAARHNHLGKGPKITEDGQVLMTDFDYFEHEIRKCRERISYPQGGDTEHRERDQIMGTSLASSADVIGLRRDCQRAIDICAAMLKYAKEKYSENIEREQELDALRVQNMDLQSKSSRDLTLITK